MEEVRTDSRGDAYRLRIEPTSDIRPSTAIVEGVAAIRETDPVDLAPLGEHVDPDCLDGLFEPPLESESGSVSVSFTYAGCNVVVSGPTLVTITVAS